MQLVTKVKMCHQFLLVIVYTSVKCKQFYADANIFGIEDKGQSLSVRFLSIEVGYQKMNGFTNKNDISEDGHLLMADPLRNRGFCIYHPSETFRHPKAVD